jgi:hypothetical protein
MSAMSGSRKLVPWSICGWPTGEVERRGNAPRFSVVCRMAGDGDRVVATILRQPSHGSGPAAGVAEMSELTSRNVGATPLF